jgi:hypothetical protein
MKARGHVRHSTRSFTVEVQDESRYSTPPFPRYAFLADSHAQEPRITGLFYLASNGF